MDSRGVCERRCGFQGLVGFTAHSDSCEIQDEIDDARPPELGPTASGAATRQRSQHAPVPAGLLHCRFEADHQHLLNGS